jgi:recombination protein RecA
VAAFVDAEHSINPEYARMLGVDIDNLLISQPSNGEEALEIVEALVRSNGVRLIVVDSVAALVPKSELDGEMGDSHVGQHARLMSQAMRKLTGAMHRSSTTVIFINQLRDKIGVMFGNPEVTTGGKALKFYASVRLDVRRAESIKDANGVIGNTVKVKVVKNKVAPPFKDTIFPIIYSQGLDQLGEILTLGERYAVLEKRGGGWYYFGEERLGRGSEGAKEFLRSNPEMLTQITDGIKSRAQNTSAGILTNTSPKIALQAPSD